ncbi:MAG: ABC transporter permease [Cyclobacteriaceae bacterium]|nr:ABC transporter permease [Cyclobacteriaceae bacterium]
MLSNYFKLFLRQLRSVYAAINLLGLVIGLTAFILIFLWVADEWSFDRFHADANRVYRVVENQLNDKEEVYPVAATPAPLGPHLKATFAEVEAVGRTGNLDLNLRKDDIVFLQKGLLADPEIFEFLHFPLLHGSMKPFNEGTEIILITERLAQVYFATTDPVGKSLTLLGREMLIAGVLHDIPANSHLQFDFVLPMQFARAGGFDQLENWKVNNYSTYVKLTPDGNPGHLQQKIKNVIKEHHETSNVTDLVLQPLTDVYLKSQHLNNNFALQGNILYVYLSSAIGLFILIIASINYANLATARSIKRAKEAGVRKVIGANKVQLIIHFLSESFLYCLLAFAIAVVLSWLALPWFKELSGKPLVFDLTNTTIFVPLTVSVVVCAFLGGAYPAFLLSALNPAHVLKGYVKSSRSTILFRRALVVLQFILAISFLAGTFIVQDQLAYIRARDLGFQKENIITFTTNRKMRQQFSSLKGELLKLPGVENVSAMSARISNVVESTTTVKWEGKDPNYNILFHTLPVEFDFVKTFSMKVVAGRDFSEAMATDSSAVIINQEAARLLGFADPIGKTIEISQGEIYTIIGVVGDFNFKSAHKKIEPLLIYNEPDSYYEAVVRFAPGNLVQQVEAVKEVFKKFNSGISFSYKFVEEDIDQSYRAEERTSNIFNHLATLSIFISCLGLLGMVMFVTEQRAKEVAMRKVLGASVPHLTWLLAREFIVLIVIAFAIAAPAMYYAGNLWLGNFAYRIEADVFLFIWAGMISLAVAAVTVGFRAGKVAMSNPIGPLRSE